MSKTKILLLVSLSFAAGVLVGAGGTRLAVRHFIRQAMAHPEVFLNKIQDDMASTLGLNAAQQDQIRKILDQTHGRMCELRTEYHPRFQAILSQGENQINHVLTPEQQQKFKEYLKHNEMFWSFPRPHGPRGPRPGPPPFASSNVPPR